MCNHHKACCVTIFVILLALGIDLGHSFSSHPPTFATRRQQGSIATTKLNLFGSLGDAFKSDDTLGKAENPGLKNGPKYNDQVFFNGKKVPGAVVGQKLTVVAGKVRVKIPVSCQKGDCGTCEVLLNGRFVKACQTPLPAGRCNIETK